MLAARFRIEAAEDVEDKFEVTFVGTAAATFRFLCPFRKQ
jgi:hypothetical protein